jgi:hypothetical protein
MFSPYLRPYVPLIFLLGKILVTKCLVGKNFKKSATDGALIFTKNTTSTINQFLLTFLEKITKLN